MAKGLEKVNFRSNPKEGQCQRMFKLQDNCTNFKCQQGNAQNPSSQASTVCEPRTYRCTAEFRTGRGTRNQTANICWITEKGRGLQKSIYFYFIDYAKAFDCVDHNKLGKILKEMGIPLHLICLPRNFYVSQEATVRTRHGTKHQFKYGKGVYRGCISSSCLFNLYVGTS